MQNALELQLSVHGRAMVPGAQRFGWRHRARSKAGAPFPSDSPALTHSLPVTATGFASVVGCSKGTSSLSRPLRPVLRSKAGTDHPPILS